jgi:transcriptional regulator with XRE-family HTH domain
MSKLKRRIKSSLAKEGFTMTDLAIRMNVTQGMLSNYLRSESMKMSTALKISDSLADMTGCHLTLNDFRKNEQ